MSVANTKPPPSLRYGVGLGPPGPNPAEHEIGRPILTPGGRSGRVGMVSRLRVTST